MDRQYDRRKHRNGEVNLVRMSSYDNRVSRGGGGRRRRRRAKNSAILLAFSLFLIVTCMGALYYVMRLEARENMSDIEVDGTVDQQTGTVLGKTPERDEDAVPEREEPTTTGIPQGEKIPLVAIDAGHGGVDGGSDRKGVLEKEVNLEIAERLAEKLEDLGFEVLMIREDNDTFITKQDRAAKANEAGADVYISVHQNTYEEQDNEVSGVETYYCEDTEGSKRFAELVHTGVVTATGARDRNLRETDGLYVVREANMPSCLVECSYLTNKKEREAIVTQEYQDKLAEGMAEGIYKFFYGDEQ